MRMSARYRRDEERHSRETSTELRAPKVSAMAPRRPGSPRTHLVNNLGRQKLGTRCHARVGIARYRIVSSTATVMAEGSAERGPQSRQLRSGFAESQGNTLNPFVSMVLRRIWSTMLVDRRCSLATPPLVALRR